MTTSMSLKKWKKLGQLEREISIYRKLAYKLGKVNIYTYGSNENSILNNERSIVIGAQKQSRLWRIKIKSARIRSYLDYCWNFYNLFAKHILFKSVDIIKTNQYRGSVFGVVIKKIYNKPLNVRMGWYHGHFKKLDRKKRIVEKWIFRNSDKIIITNKIAKEFICNSYNIKPESILVLPNSIDTDIFKPINSFKDIDIIYVGRLHEEKNLDLLFSSIKLIKRPLNILIIGDGDIKIFEKLLMINKHNVKNIRKVPNYDLPIYLNRSKIFVLLSKYEGNPKTLLEAMSCGLPVIGNNAPGISEIINDNDNGVLVDNNAIDLSKLIQLILKDSKFAEKLGINARLSIKENFHLEKIINKEVQMIKSILS